MIASAFDVDSAMGVLVVGPPCDDEGWLAYVRRIDEMKAQIPPGKAPVLMQILRSGTDMPSPRVRRAIADLRARMPTNAVNVVIVESAGIRMMQTALDWLRKPHYHTSTHAHLESGLAHLERHLGKPVPVLRRLVRQVT